MACSVICSSMWCVILLWFFTLKKKNRENIVSLKISLSHSLLSLFTSKVCGYFVMFNYSCWCLALLVVCTLFFPLCITSYWFLCPLWRVRDMQLDAGACPPLAFGISSPVGTGSNCPKPGMRKHELCLIKGGQGPNLTFLFAISWPRGNILRNYFENELDLMKVGLWHLPPVIEGSCQRLSSSCIRVGIRNKNSFQIWVSTQSFAESQGKCKDNHNFLLKLVFGRMSF